MGLTGTISCIAIVAVSVIIVIAIIVIMSRTMPGKRYRETPVAPERERVIKPRLSFLQRIRSKPAPEPDEESLIPAPPLEAVIEEPLIPVIEPAAIPITAAAPESYADSFPAAEIAAPPAEEEEMEIIDIGKPQGDDGLNTFRIEIAEDDGLSRIAESLEDINLDKLSEIAQDISNRRIRKSGR